MCVCVRARARLQARRDKCVGRVVYVCLRAHVWDVGKRRVRVCVCVSVCLSVDGALLCSASKKIHYLTNQNIIYY